MPKFAANLTMLFTEVPFMERFGAAADAGFRAVEFSNPFDFPAEAIAEELKRHNLENVLFNMPAGNRAAGENGLGALPGREEEYRASVDQALEYAQVLGTKRVNSHSGILPQGSDLAQSRAIYISNLTYATQQAQEIGVTVVMEPINQRDMPGYFLNRQDDAHSIREEVGAPNLKVQMDFYHCQIVEGDIETKLRQYLPGVGHIQIAGVPARHEPDVGEVNYPYLLNLLDEVGYDGWVGCEYRPANGTVEGLGWVSKMGFSL